MHESGMISMPPVVDTKILFRLELSYAVDSDIPLSVSIQCGYAACERYVDAPSETNPVICVPITIPTDVSDAEALQLSRIAWATAINEAYDHLMWHQAAHEQRS